MSISSMTSMEAHMARQDASRLMSESMRRGGGNVVAAYTDALAHMLEVQGGTKSRGSRHDRITYLGPQRQDGPGVSPLPMWSITLLSAGEDNL